MTQKPIQLPPCGMFIGTGIYPTSAGYLVCALYGHQSWIPETNHPIQMLERVLSENQGNLVQFWGVSRGYSPATHALWFYALDELGIHIPEPDWKTGTHTRAHESAILKEHEDRHGAGIYRFVMEARKRGLYSTVLYTDAKPHWSARLQEAGQWYLGYDFGERFTFRFDNGVTQASPNATTIPTLGQIADDLIGRVKAHVDDRRAKGWGPIMATSINFYIDYEILAGVDIPVIEDFAFSHLNVASALSRGLYRQHRLPLWGAHLAHEHYSWIPNAHPHKFSLLTAGLFQKYAAGCKLIINESGNWFVEASLCQDSPKFQFPRVPLNASQITYSGPRSVDFSQHIPAASEHFHKIGYDSDLCKRYRRVISDFYDFVKEHGTPVGQPETTVALIKGNLDLCAHRFSPSQAVAGVWSIADIDPRWYEGAPEASWEIAKQVFYPLKPVLGTHKNRFLSGAPLGMVDIVSFGLDRIDPDILAQHYKALIYVGWNTCSTTQYETMCRYVRAGGTLVVALPHLSTDQRRNYAGFKASDLVHGGDFTELLGLKVIGPERRIYWAVPPEENSELGESFPRRFGILGCRIGQLEFTSGGHQPLLVDDERAAPVILRRQLGQGQVYFINTWAYPGAINTDEGPGATADSPGMVGTLWRYIGLQHRGKVWISDDTHAPGRQCDFITYSYFPESGHICLLNTDFESGHDFYLHVPDGHHHIRLAPAEFRLINKGDLKTVSHFMSERPVNRNIGSISSSLRSSDARTST